MSVTLLFLSFMIAGTAQAQHHVVYWYRCTFSHHHRSCHEYRVTRAPHQPIAYWKRCRQKTCVRYPEFKKHEIVVDYTAGTYWITGYSFYCGVVNATTADGSAPQVGDVSSDNPSFWHHYIYVPSLDYHGYVNDDGVGTGGFDLFMPNCAATYPITGPRIVYIYR